MIRSKEVDDHYSRRMLELSRASYDAFVANERYRRLRLREIDIMRAVAVDELEEAITVRKRAGGQIGEVRHILSISGTALVDNQLQHFPVGNSDCTSESGADIESDVDSPSLASVVA